MARIALWGLTATALSAFPVVSGASDVSRSTLLRELPSVMQAAGIPGLSIAIVDHAEVTVRAYGYCDSAGRYPVEPGTLFEAASLTKPVFTYGVMGLLGEGRLDLDRPLTDYVDFPDIENDDRVNQITARMVLNHTSGLPNWRRGNPLTIGPDPGTEFGYSGEAYEFLQKAVEKITGQRMDVFLEKRVFGPLGMKNSFLVWDDSLAPRTATGHDFIGNEREKWKPDAPGPAGTLHTTAGDYALFLAEMMNPTLLDVSLVAQMLRPQSDVADGVFWGFGWSLEEAALEGASENELLFWHDGDNGWFKCYAMARPKQSLAMVYFTNSQNGHSIAGYVVASVFGGTHPAIAWTEYAAYDSPAFRIQRSLARAGLDRGAEGVRAEYASLVEVYPREAFDEAMLNRLGYRLIGLDANAAAVAVFRINVETYPDSWNVYDSLGEGLAAVGDTTEAIACYQKSVGLNPENTNGVEMLKKLRRRAEE